MLRILQYSSHCSFDDLAQLGETIGLQLLAYTHFLGKQQERAGLYPFVASNSEPLARDRLPVPDALHQAIANDRVLVFTYG